MDWVKKLNELPEDARDGRNWHYVLLGENTFYTLHGNNASIADILEHAALTQGRFDRDVMGKLL
jgi:type III restriction enzyme